MVKPSAISLRPEEKLPRWNVKELFGLGQQTEEFDRLYRLRPAVEQKIAELARRGVRETRYVGESKRQLQRLWLGAAVNLKRLFRLVEVQKADLVMLLSRLQPPETRCAAV